MKRIGRLFFYILITLFLTTTFAFAEVNVSVEVNPESVGLGDQIQISLLIQSNDDLEVEEPALPETDGLTLIHAQNSGQSTSSRMNIINGKTEFSKTVTQQYDFVVQANRTGVVTIPSFQVTANGKKITTAPQKISVGKTSQNVNPQRQKQRPNNFPPSPFGEEDDDDMFAQLMRQRQKMIEDMQKQMGRGGARGGQANPLEQFFGAGQEPQEIQSKKLDVNEKEAFFIYLDIDKKEVFEGEQVTANWYIYTRGNLETIDRAKFPDLKGFWKEIIEEVPNLQFTEEIVNGVRFKKGLLASHALFPIKTGVAVVDEFKIKGKVRLPTQFGWGQLQEYTKSSRRTQIKVLPLPVEGKPQSFSGAVGQFQIQTQVDGMQFPANQPFTLKVRFEGAGNAKLIELPPIEWPAGLEVYDTKSESKFYKNGQSFKEFEILLVPKNTGDVKIPQINFSYFDPEQRKYISKSTESLDLKITEGLAENKNLQSGSNGSGASSAATEKLNPVLEFPGSFSWMENRMSILFSSLALIVVFIFGWHLKENFQIEQMPQFRKIIDQKIRHIEKSLSQNNERKVGTEVVDLIYLLLAQLAQEKKAVTEWNQMISKVPQNYRDKYEGPLSEKFEYFQIVGFAPDEVKTLVTAKAPVKESFQHLKKLTSQIIGDLPKT